MQTWRDHINSTQKDVTPANYWATKSETVLTAHIEEKQQTHIGKDKVERHLDKGMWTKYEFTNVPKQTGQGQGVFPLKHCHTSTWYDVLKMTHCISILKYPTPKTQGFVKSLFSFSGLQQLLWLFGVRQIKRHLLVLSDPPFSCPTGGELHVSLCHHPWLLLMVHTDGPLPEGNPPPAHPLHAVGPS